MDQREQSCPVSVTQLQTTLDDLVMGTGGGVAMASVDMDSVTFFCAGIFDAKNPQPITPDTQFEIASLTKVFTALLLAKSEREGLVHRNDPVAKYLLPADDPQASTLAKITLLQLATHHSGLPREPSSIQTLNSNFYPFAGYTNDKLVCCNVLNGSMTHNRAITAVPETLVCHRSGSHTVGFATPLPLLTNFIVRSFF